MKKILIMFLLSSLLCVGAMAADGDKFLPLAIERDGVAYFETFRTENNPKFTQSVSSYLRRWTTSDRRILLYDSGYMSFIDVPPDTKLSIIYNEEYKKYVFSFDGDVTYYYLYCNGNSKDEKGYILKDFASYTIPSNQIVVRIGHVLSPDVVTGTLSSVSGIVFSDFFKNYPNDYTTTTPINNLIRNNNSNPIALVDDGHLFCVGCDGTGNNCTAGESSEPETPKPPIMDFPIIGTVTDEYIPYDTVVWDEFFIYIRTLIGNSTNIGFKIFSVLIGIFLIHKVVKMYIK